MSLHKLIPKVKDKKTIFRALFVPLIFIMILQSCLFYFSAVYGGVEDSLTQNAADIMNERLANRTNELENNFTNTWSNFQTSTTYLNQLYSEYEQSYGESPFQTGSEPQIQFLRDSASRMIDMLRQNQVNGVYLILNDMPVENSNPTVTLEKKYGICIRDMDQKSAYVDTEDLLLECAPSSMINELGCSLASWWEAQFSFSSQEEGDFYYKPLQAAFEYPESDSDDLAYFSPPHKLNGGGQDVVSYSIPLISENGHPYGVLGVELTAKYLSTLMPGADLGASDAGCYVLAMQNSGSTDCDPIVSNGALYNRCFDSTSVISTSNTAKTGGFTITGRGNTELYGSKSTLTIYNTNNPFEDQQLVLIALEESATMFAYIAHIKNVLLTVSMISLILGILCILVVSRNFATPITALAKRVRNMAPEEGFQLDRIGIREIDQLVESIENLNQNASRYIARTEFFSRMSHDMRTPMNAIISFSSPELLEGTDDATKKKYLEKIHSSGEYLLGLINEVLDITKIESNKTDLSYEPIYLESLWNTSISIIEKLTQKKKITFVKEIQGNPDIFVMADGQHINQIVLNLLSNAVKFTPEGGKIILLIHISSPSDQSSKVYCNISIQDNGIGMSEDFMNNLYIPFEQEHENGEGTGLGLSIAKKLVELMSGTIECHSKQNIGTTFNLRIPLEICDTPSVSTVSTKTESTTPVSAAGGYLNGKHILVCEDHPLNTQIICSLLQKAGVIVTTAENGQVGVDIFSQSQLHAFDAILMDIRMPIMNGYAATRAIRSLPREDATTIPILAMTANAFVEDVRESQQAGMNAHLSKPIEPQKLFYTLESFLNDN